MPTADVLQFAEVLSEITMGGSRIEGVSRPDVPGFVVEIIERGFSDDSRKANALVAIFEILKRKRFAIVAEIDCDEVLKFVSLAKSSEESLQ
jgi:hypothetical protein